MDAVQPLLRELLGHAVRRERHAQGLTLAQVAARSGVSIQHLSDVERGRKDPSSEVLAAITGALDLEVTDLAARIARSAAHRDEAARLGVAQPETFRPAGIRRRPGLDPGPGAFASSRGLTPAHSTSRDLASVDATSRVITTVHPEVPELAAADPATLVLATVHSATADPTTAPGTSAAPVALAELAEPVEPTDPVVAVVPVVHIVPVVPVLPVVPLMPVEHLEHLEACRSVTVLDLTRTRPQVPTPASVDDVTRARTPGPLTGPVLAAA